MRPLVALLLLISFASAAPVPKALKKKDDAAMIVGTWKPATKGTTWFRFDADGTLQTWQVRNKGTAEDWTYTLDPTTTPKQMKLTKVAARTCYECIYELDGDSLRLAFVLGAKDPKKVEAADGMQLYEQTRDTSAK